MVAFCDNNTKLHDTVYNGIFVRKFENIAKNEYDYIVIASHNYEEEIYQQLIGETDKPIFTSYIDLIDRRFSIDISGWCNAKCMWCATGRKNLKNQGRKDAMSYETFVSVYNHLRGICLLHPYNEIMLYSWGEPFLNSHYSQIVRFLSENNQVFSLSTNASSPVLLSENNVKLYKNCKTVVFSMPGFSQDSYDAMHGFSITIIKENIRKIVSNLQENGFEGRAVIAYHIYKTNYAELASAKEFAEELGIDIEPACAYFASYELSKEYLLGNLQKDDCFNANKFLVLDYVKDLIKLRPDDYHCLVENVVSIHWDGSIELCCCCDDSATNFLWKKIYEIKNLREWREYRSKMLKSDTCLECRDLGIDYWFFSDKKIENI